MNVKHEQFIGIYENAFSKEYCDRVITYFENMVNAGHAFSRQQANISKLDKEDLSIFGSSEELVCSSLSANLQNEFNNSLWTKGYSIYAKEFSILTKHSPHSSYAFKIQKTEPGQGYHTWHSEAMDRATCNRILVWTLYLNDVEDGGETEFLYQKIRIKPKTGTLIIWPAAFTHTHRGNPPLSGSKYIVTGWIEF